MSEDRVLSALRALREADAEREASPELEARLVQAFRRRKQRVWRWASVGIAAGIVGLAALLAVERLMETPQQAQRQVTVAPLVQAPPASTVVAEPPSMVVSPAPAKPRPVRRKPSLPLREVVTQFYPLMDTPPPFERGELVRVSLPAAALWRAGFEVEGSGPDDSVEAEVLFGQEGLARAIRFVSYQ